MLTLAFESLLHLQTNTQRVCTALQPCLAVMLAVYGTFGPPMSMLAGHTKRSDLRIVRISYLKAYDLPREGGR